MSITMTAPAGTDTDVTTFADQIADLTRDGVEGVSYETLELIKEVAREMEPVRASARLGSRVSPHEEQLVTQRLVDLIKVAYVRSGGSEEVGLGLAAFAIRQFGCKFRPISGFVVDMLDRDHPTATVKVKRMLP